MSTLTFRQQCALVLLERYADKMFDRQFQREAIDAGMEVEDFIAVHALTLTDAMCAVFDN